MVGSLLLAGGGPEAHYHVVGVDRIEAAVASCAKLSAKKSKNNKIKFNMRINKGAINV